MEKISLVFVSKGEGGEMRALNSRTLHSLILEREGEGGRFPTSAPMVLIFKRKGKSGSTSPTRAVQKGKKGRQFVLHCIAGAGNQAVKGEEEEDYHFFRRVEGKKNLPSIPNT